MLETVAWRGDSVRILDQTCLPGEIKYSHLHTVDEVVEAIKSLRVRGAPLIGVTAAYGLALAAVQHDGPRDKLDQAISEASQALIAARPTAVNLRWAVNRLLSVYREKRSQDLDSIRSSLVEAARRMQEQDLLTNQAIGRVGAGLLKPGTRVLTICNAGALATCGHGTALGIVRSAFADGKVNRVYACETRPVLQGSRLTVWELAEDDIPVTLITDNMAGYVMQRGEVDVVITGADRIAVNGDTANKIGTYGLAVLALHHGIPFYVAAPVSSVDFDIASGDRIPIESRNPDEVRKIGATYITRPEVDVLNPAFDVTPGSLITAIITEKGIARFPYEESLNCFRPPELKLQEDHP